MPEPDRLHARLCLFAAHTDLGLFTGLLAGTLIGSITDTLALGVSFGIAFGLLLDHLLARSRRCDPSSGGRGAGTSGID